MTTKELKIQRALGLLNISDMPLEQLLRFRNNLERDNENCEKDFDDGLFREVLNEIKWITRYLSFAEEVDLMDKGLYPYRD